MCPTERFEWIKILEVDENPSDGFVAEFYFRSRRHLCYKFGEEYHVFPAKCPHNGAAMSPANVNIYDKTITCPLHHYCFDILSGKLLHGASVCRMEKIPSRVHNGMLYLGVPVPWWKF